MKFLLWLVIGYVLVTWYMRGKKALPAGAPTRRASSGAWHSSEPMRQCAVCEIYIPASEALPHASGVVFCCEEHRRRFPG